MSDSSTSALSGAKPVLLLLEHDSKIPSTPAAASSVAMAGCWKLRCRASMERTAGWRCAGSASRGRVAKRSALSAKVTKRYPRW
nr:hypothetical protein [Xanthomonas arboricola]